MFCWFLEYKEAKTKSILLRSIQLNYLLSEVLLTKSEKERLFAFFHKFFLNVSRKMDFQQLNVFLVTWWIKRYFLFSNIYLKIRLTAHWVYLCIQNIASSWFMILANKNWQLCLSMFLFSLSQSCMSAFFFRFCAVWFITIYFALTHTADKSKTQFSASMRLFIHCLLVYSVFFYSQQENQRRWIIISDFLVEILYGHLKSNKNKMNGVYKDGARRNTWDEFLTCWTSGKWWR